MSQCWQRSARAALEAEDPRREAAAVEEQDRLAARRRASRPARGAAARESIELAPARRRRALAREVDDLDRRAAGGPRCGAAATSRRSSPRSAAKRVSSEGVAEPSTSGQPARAARRAREIARVVAEALLVLVRAVVLLVDHDQAEVARAARRARSARRRRSASRPRAGAATARGARRARARCAAPRARRRSARAGARRSGA